MQRSWRTIAGNPLVAPPIVFVGVCHRLQEHGQPGPQPACGLAHFLVLIDSEPSQRRMRSMGNAPNLSRKARSP
jgi:hypothetical protein